MPQKSPHSFTRRALPFYRTLWSVAPIVLLLSGCMSLSDLRTDASEPVHVRKIATPTATATRSGRAGPDNDVIEIFHTNDMHASFAGNRNGAACLKETDCSGGYGAIAEFVKQAKTRFPDALFLDAGDQFQGSLLYIKQKSPLVSRITNAMGYDYATSGNHEFDEGCEALRKHIDGANFPFLAANLKVEGACPLKGASNLRPYAVRVVNGRKIGIIGLANPDVVAESGACSDTRFSPPVKAVRDAVRELEAQNVHRIIVLSHMGLPFDKRLAQVVNGIDIIVGGHSHKYLGPGSSVGPYPVTESAPNGKPVLIVTTPGKAKYVGQLTVRFSEDGTVLSGSGAPVRMKQAGGNPEITRHIDSVADEILKENRTPIGRNRVVFKDGLEACREGDCLSAQAVTNAMLDYAKPYGATIALINGGSFRNALPVGAITHGDIESLQPFKDVIEIRAYTGAQLKEAIEHGVSDTDGIGPRLLQPSGLRYRYIATAPVGSRVQSIEIRQPNGRFEPLNPEARYRVATNTFLTRGDDGHQALSKDELIAAPINSIPEIFTAWLGKHAPLSFRPEARILQLPEQP